MVRRFCGVFLILVLLGGVIGCNVQQTPMYQKFTYSFSDVFDTEIYVIAYAKNEVEFAAWAKQLQERFQELHRLFDIYHEYPGLVNLKTLNERAGGEPLGVAPEIIGLLQLGIEGYQRSGGLVDITLGPVLEIWHELRMQALQEPENSRLPQEEELRAAAELRGVEDIELDEAAGTARLARSGMSLNVGAIAKGYATELVAGEMCEMGITSFLIDAGGNIRVMDKPLDGASSRWGIAIQNPLGYSEEVSSEAQSIYVDAVFGNNISVVTSGGYQRVYFVEGQSYHHLIDPRTLQPGRGCLSATAVVEDAGWADLYSTALFLMNPKEALEFALQEDHLAVFFIAPDGEVYTSAAMDGLLGSKGVSRY